MQIKKSKFSINKNYILLNKNTKQNYDVFIVEITPEYIFLRDSENFLSNEKYISPDYILDLDSNGKIENSKLELKLKKLII